MTEEQSSQSNRRSAIRVSIPLAVENVLVESGHLIASRVEVLSRCEDSESLLSLWVRSERAKGELEDTNPVLIEMLLEMDRKLEKLLSSSQQSDTVSTAKAINLSSNGMLICTEQHLPASSYVRLGFELPFFPRTQIDLIAKVVRSEEKLDNESGGAKYYAAVEFDTIHEADREHLIQYILEKEREIIRARKSQQLSL